MAVACFFRPDNETKQFADRKGLDMREPKMTVKKSRRKFRRQNWFWKQKLGDKWRRPGGNQSKMRRKWKSKMKLVTIGYKQKSDTREMLKGFRPVVVNNAEELQNINGGAKEGVVIASSLGAKNILKIEKRAKELNLKILNPRALERVQRAVRGMKMRKEQRKKDAEEKGKAETAAKAGAKSKAESKAESKAKDMPKQKDGAESKSDK